MNALFTKIQRFTAGATLVVASALWAGATSRADGEEVGVQVKPVSVEKLANVPGKSITAVVVNYAPGGKSGARTSFHT